MSVEAVCSCVYAMTEVAAGFANQVSRSGSTEGQLPRSFNALKKQLRDGMFQQLATQLGELHGMTTSTRCGPNGHTSRRSSLVKTRAASSSVVRHCVPRVIGRY